MTKHILNLIIILSLQACASVSFKPHEDFFTEEITSYEPYSREVIVFTQMPSFTIRYDKVGTFTALAKSKHHTTTSLLALIKHHAAQKGANAIILNYEHVENDNLHASVKEMLKGQLSNKPRLITADAIRINGSIRGLVEKFKNDALEILNF